MIFRALRQIFFDSVLGVGYSEATYFSLAGRFMDFSTIGVSAILGVVEGLTEFLPISSTAHLRLTEALLHLDLTSGYWKMYSVVIQLGAILSVPILFRDKLKQLVLNFPKGASKNKTVLTHPLSLVILAFGVTALPAYIADKTIGKNLENLTVMAFALLIGGVLMFLVDKVLAKSKRDNLEQMNTLDAFWIGSVQILSAVFPGTSRSMSTIIAAQSVGLSRSVALEFSFFLAIPTMLAATLYKLLHVITHRPKTPVEVALYGAPSHQWLILAIGFFVSFAVAFFVNRWLIQYVKSKTFTAFAIYRVILGSVILIAIFGFNWGK